MTHMLFRTEGLAAVAYKVFYDDDGKELTSSNDCEEVIKGEGVRGEGEMYIKGDSEVPSELQHSVLRDNLTLTAV